MRSAGENWNIKKDLLRKCCLFLKKIYCNDMNLKIIYNKCHFIKEYNILGMNHEETWFF